jgi:hypothetical protein
MTTRSQQQRDARLRADLESIVAPEPRLSAPVLLWRWRYEIAAVMAAAGLLIMLVTALGKEWATISLAALAGLVSPPWPTWLTARLRCVVTPHRLRSGFVQARIQTRRGRLPVIVRTTPEPFGERVRLWCPAGISAEDFRSARDTLRAACWARDVRVTRNERQSHRITLDVIRRGTSTS